MNSGNKKTILVVEDEKSIRYALTEALRFKNFLSLEAQNGREGVDIALSKHPDLILLDLVMPVMDGAAALKEIREDAWGAKVPVIILTNLSATNENLMDYMEKNLPIFYLVKSNWKLKDLIKKIENVLEIEESQD